MLAFLDRVEDALQQSLRDRERIDRRMVQRDDANVALDLVIDDAGHDGDPF